MAVLKLMELELFFLKQMHYMLMEMRRTAWIPLISLLVLKLLNSPWMMHMQQSRINALAFQSSQTVGDIDERR